MLNLEYALMFIAGTCFGLAIGWYYSRQLRRDNDRLRFDLATRERHMADRAEREDKLVTALFRRVGLNGDVDTTPGRVLDRSKKRIAELVQQRRLRAKKEDARWQEVVDEDGDLKPVEES